jgi:membrane protease YdiL (CAAX protease family)
MLIIFNLYDISLGRYQGNLIPFLIVLVRGVIAAPIAEEIIFRGIFFGWFLTKSEEWHSNARYLIIVIGLLVQAAVFMLGHFEIFNPKRLINGFIFGLLFLVFKRNLLPSLVAHGAFNLYVIMLTL